MKILSHIRKYPRTWTLLACFVLGVIGLWVDINSAQAATHPVHRCHWNCQPPPPVTPPPTQPPPVTPPISGLKCMGFGYEPINGQYNLTQDAAWLTQLKNAGYNCVRIAAYGQNPDVVKPLDHLAHTMGFYVWQQLDGFSSNFYAYDSGVLAYATDEQQRGDVQQIGIGNEADYNSGVAPTLVISHLSGLSCQVRKVYGGDISYTTYKGDTYDALKAWTQNMGCLTYLAANTYADYQNTYAELQSLIPGRWEVGEWNLDCDYNNQCGNDTTWAAGVQKIEGYLAPYGVPAAFFALVTGGDGTHTAFGALGHPTVMSALGL